MKVHLGSKFIIILTSVGGFQGWLSQLAVTRVKIMVDQKKAGELFKCLKNGEYAKAESLYREALSLTLIILHLKIIMESFHWFWISSVSLKRLESN